MDDASTPDAIRRTMAGMDLEHWIDLDLAYLLALGEHPDLTGSDLMSEPGETVAL